MFFSPFSIAITSLGEERANLNAFRTFVRCLLVWFCRFPLPLGVWEGFALYNQSPFVFLFLMISGLQFVIVALPGLFSYHFLWLCHFLDFFLTFSFVMYLLEWIPVSIHALFTQCRTRALRKSFHYLTKAFRRSAILFTCWFALWIRRESSHHENIPI